MKGVSPRTTVEVEVEIVGEIVRGSFTWRRRTVADNGAISAEMSRLTGGTAIVDEGMRALIAAQAELQVVTEKWPEWWRYETLDDSTLVAVYRRYMEWRDSFRRRAEAGADGNGAESGPARTSPVEPGGRLASPMVGA